MFLAKLLNSEAAKGFFRSLVFWDAKRPITAQLLSSLDLGILAEEAGGTLPIRTDTTGRDLYPVSKSAGALGRR